MRATALAIYYVGMVDRESAEPAILRFINICVYFVNKFFSQFNFRTDFLFRGNVCTVIITPFPQSLKS